MARAAALGALDFSQARPREHGWRIRRDWILSALEEDLAARYLDVRHRFTCALVSRAGTPEGLEKAIEGAEENRQSLGEVLMPWLFSEQKAHKKSQRRHLAESWKATWGSTDDPETQARIAWTVKALYDRAREAQKKNVV